MRKQIKTNPAMRKVPFATTNQVEILIPDNQSADSSSKTNSHNLTLNFNWMIENFTDRRIVVGTRDGMTHTVQPITSRAQTTVPGVYIRRQISASQHAVKFDAYNRLNDPLNQEQAIIKSRYTEGRGNTGHFNVEYYYFISLESLHEAGGCIYVREVDMFISIFDQDVDIVHPFSDRGLEIYTTPDGDTLVDKELGTVSYRYVDNLQTRLAVYVNVAGKVLRIPARRDITRANGMYITYVNRVDRNVDKDRPEEPIIVDFIPIEEFGSHDRTIFTTYEDAKHLGDLQKQREMDLKQRDYELATQKRELAALQLEVQRELDAQKHQTFVETQRLNRLAEEAKHANLMEKLKLEKQMAETRAEQERASVEFQSKQRELEAAIRAREAKFKELEQEREQERKEYERQRDEEAKRREHDRKEYERQRDDELKRRELERKEMERIRAEEAKEREHERKEMERIRAEEAKEREHERKEMERQRDHERKEFDRQREEEIARREQERKEYERLREEEVARREQERKDYEREEAIRREREKARLDAERARDEFERTRDKAREDNYRDREKYERNKKQEDESHWRKTTIEFLKVVGTALTTIGAIAIWKSKMKK